MGWKEEVSKLGEVASSVDGGKRAGFGEEMREKHFSFAPGYRPLNHGSFGVFPIQVRQYWHELHRQNEARPDTFFRYTYLNLLKEARAAVAPLLGADVGEVVLIPNATTGVNTVLRNLEFVPGDVVLHFNTIYGACLKTIQSLGETGSVRPFRLDITYPIEDDEILRLFEETVKNIRQSGNEVRLAMFDTVLTFPGVRFPWESLVGVCKRIGVKTLIDGAHGIGHIDLRNVGEVKPDFLISNCYKWLMTPRGCSILYVPFENQHLIRTTFPTSWGYEVPKIREAMSDNDYFVRLFVKVSTSDTTPFACIPAALKFREEVCGGEQTIRSHCEQLAKEGGLRMAKVLGTEVLENASNTLRRCHFTNVKLPLELSELAVAESEGVRIAKWMQEKTPQEYETYIPIKFYAGAFWLRISGQIYLTLEDFDWAAQTVLKLCERAKIGEWKDCVGARPAEVL